MAERIVVREPFETNAEAMGFFDALKAQMHALGYTIVPEPAFNGISTTDICFFVDDRGFGEILGRARLVITNGQMAIEVADNIFAERNLTAIAHGLGLPPSDALELAASAMFDETESGGCVLMAIVPNVE